MFAPNHKLYTRLKRILAGRCFLQSLEFLSGIALVPGVTFVRSPKGSGKTERLAELLLQCKEQGLSVLLIGHRQALIHNICARLGLTCYLRGLDGKQAKNDPDDHFAICVDSMGSMLKPNAISYDVCVIDESDQVFSHIVSDTLKTKRRHCFQVLCHFLKRAKYVILCDADLGSITVEVMTQIVGEDVPYRFILNDYRPPEREFELYADSNHLVSDMLATIGIGGRHFIACNSKRQATLIHTTLEKAFPDKKFILVTSAQSTDVATQHFINNIKSEILKYDGVVVSPSLGTGIDIKFEGSAQEIDTVFGFFVARVNTHFDICQQLSRVRDPKNIKVYVTPEKFQFETDANAIEAELILCRNLNDMLEGYDRSGMPVLEKTYLKLYTTVTAMQRASKNNLRENFIQLRASNGWQAKMIDRSKEDSKTGGSLLSEAADVIATAKAGAIIKAAPITHEEYRLLIDRQRSEVLSILDENSLRNYELSSFYRATVNEDLVALDDDGLFRKKIRLAEVFMGTQALITNRSLRAEDHKQLASDAMNLSLKRDLLRELLSSAGLLSLDQGILCDVAITNGKLTAFVLSARRNIHRIQELFDLSIRSDLPKNPVQSLSAILDLMGLKLEKTANYKIAGKRTREYQIDEALLELVKGIVVRRATVSVQSATLVWPLPPKKYTEKARGQSRPRKKMRLEPKPKEPSEEELTVIRARLDRLLKLDKTQTSESPKEVIESPQAKVMNEIINSVKLLPAIRNETVRAEFHALVADPRTSFSFPTNRFVTREPIEVRPTDCRAGPELSKLRERKITPALKHTEQLRRSPLLMTGGLSILNKKEK